MSQWQITESDTELTVDNDGKGEISFTVTNAGEEQDRAVLTLQVSDGANEDWFAFEDPQRTVAAGDTAVYPVSVDIPMGTAPGAYGVQGVVYSADSDPQETSASSKRVAVTVAPSGPQPKPKVPPWLIALVVVLVLALVGGTIAFFVLRGGDDDPPVLAEGSEVSVTGVAQVGETLEVDEGEWTPSDTTFEYQWELFDPDPDVLEWTDIEGATGKTLDVTDEMIEKQIRVSVVAADGDAEIENPQRSSPTGLVLGVPENVEEPAVDGTVMVGSTLSVDVGEWEHAIDFLIQWERCAGPDCQEIDDAVEETYTPSNQEVGDLVRVAVKARAGNQEVTVHSAVVGPIEAIPPEIVTVPDVIGETRSSAYSMLQSLGLQRSVSTSTEKTDKCNPIVTDQQPLAGQEIEKGSIVSIVVPEYDGDYVSDCLLIVSEYQHHVAELVLRGFDDG